MLLFQHLGTLAYHYKDITTMKFEESSNILLVGSKDKTITVWSIDRKPFGKSSKPLDVIKGMGAPVNFLVSCNDVIASGSSKVRNPRSLKHNMHQSNPFAC